MVLAGSLAARVAETISRYNMLSPGHRVGVAVSGGADSLFLLLILRHLAHEHGWHLTVLHLNHALRGAESDADEVFVRAAAAHAGLACVIERAGGNLAGPNLEERSRVARYAFFARAAAVHSLDRVATAHTLNDQAETVLLRLLRGSGATGLAGIAPVAPKGVVRPLLEIERREIEAWLQERGHSWREDASNLDPAFARNRIRHTLLPQLEREWNRAISRVLARTADRLGAEEGYWQEWVTAELARVSRPHRLGLVLDLNPLAALHLAQLRRLLRAAIVASKGDLRRIDHLHLSRLVRLGQSNRGSGEVQLPGLTVTRSFDQLIFETDRPAPDFCLRITAPGPVQLPGGATLHIRVAATPVHTGYNMSAGSDAPQGFPSMAVRRWRPGDAYQPTGYGKRRKMKDLFHEHKVPSWDRRFWPIIETEGQIVWSRRFGFAAGIALEWTCEDDFAAG